MWGRGDLQETTRQYSKREDISISYRQWHKMANEEIKCVNLTWLTLQIMHHSHTLHQGGGRDYMITRDKIIV